MKVTREEINKIARLAHLRFRAEELDRFAEEFAAILEYFESLQGLDIAGIEPTSHATAGLDTGPDAYRADETRTGLSVGEALGEAPQQGNGHFLVPKFIG